MNIQTRWFIRTAIQNYYATEETKYPDTFIATPALPNNGLWEQPHVITLCCPYILEQRKRELPVKDDLYAPPQNHIEKATPVVFVVPQA